MNIRSVAHYHSMTVKKDISFTSDQLGYAYEYASSTCADGHSMCVFTGNQQIAYIGGTINYVYQTFYSTTHKKIREKAQHSHTITVDTFDITSFANLVTGVSSCSYHSQCRVNTGNLILVYPKNITQARYTWNFGSSRKNIRVTSNHYHRSPTVITGLELRSSTIVQNLATCSIGHSNCSPTTSTRNMVTLTFGGYNTDEREW